MKINSSLILKKSLNFIKTSILSKKKKKILYDYLRLYYNEKLPLDIKKDLLYNKIIYLFKNLSYKLKEKFLDIIRYNRNLRWEEKKKKIRFT